MKEHEFSVETMLAHYGEDRQKYHGAVIPPIFQNSLFTFESYEAIDEAFSDPLNHYIYTRGLNPTVEVVEKKLAWLAGGEKAKLFASGMGAISASILAFTKAGDHIVSIKSVYGPAISFMSSYLLEKLNITVTFVEGHSLQEIEDAIQDNTTILYLESPTSLIFRVLDLRAIAEIARKRGITTIIDNTWSTPLYQKPLELGIDISVHSVSKYLGGHSDVVAGVAIASEAIINRITRIEHALIGAKIAPFEAWLILRGLRTLPVRMQRHSESAQKIATFLEKQAKITHVNFPGLSSHPQHALAKQQMTGFSGLMSFNLDTNVAGVKRFLNTFKFFKIGVSWGGFESLVYAPIISIAKELPEEQWKAAGIHPGLIRISVGLENVDDLIKDIERALAAV